MADAPRKAAKVAPPRKTTGDAAARPRKVATSTRGGAAARTAISPQDRTAAVVEPTEIQPPPAKRVRPARTATTAAAALPAGAAEPAAVEPDQIIDADGATAQGDVRNDEGLVVETSITWRDRDIRVRLLTLEQLTMYRRLGRQFEALGTSGKGADEITMEEATKHFDRAVKLITSVMVLPDDIEWLEDEMLAGNLELDDAAGIIKAAFERFQQLNPANREARRQAAKKARLGD
jgi:hypothetical protein